MPVDSSSDFKPPIFEVSHKSESSTVRQKVQSVLDKWRGGRHAPETIQELASIEIPPDQSPQNHQSDNQTEVSSQIPLPTPDTAADQQEIRQIRQQIQTATAKDSVPSSPETSAPPSERTLFPDSPNLYQRYHLKYEKERKTIKGALKRSIDIRRLQKEGFKKTNAIEIYDSLRARGVPDYRINKPDPNMHRTYGREKPTDEEIISLLKKAPQIIDRLNSLGIMAEPSDFSSEHLDFYQKILTLTDQQFQEKRQQLNPFFFLKKNLSEVSVFSQETSPQVKAFLDYFSSEFLIGQNPETSSFDPIRYDIISLLDRPKNKSDLFALLGKIINSEINPDQPIKIPDSLIELFPARGYNDNYPFSALNRLSTRQEQKFLLDRFSGNQRDRYFSKKDSIPTIDFYASFYQQQSTDSDRLIEIPGETLATITNPELRSLYENVLKIQEPKFQKIGFQMVNNIRSEYNFPQYFDPDGQLTDGFWIDYLIKTRQTDIPQNYLDKLSPKSKSEIASIYFILNNIPSEEQSAVLGLYFRTSLKETFDHQGHPGPEFFKELLLIRDITPTILPLLTPDLISTFPSEKDQKFWTEISNLKHLNSDIFKYIIDHPEQSDTYFDNNFQPTEALFKDIIQNIDYNTNQFIQSNLSPELLSQKIWSCISNISDADSAIIRFVLNHEDEINLFFDQNNHITKEFIISAISSNLIQEQIKYLLNEEFLLRLPESDPDKLFLTLLGQINNLSIYHFLINNHQEISQKINSSDNPQEFIQQYSSVVEQINQSPSKEIFRIKDQLLINILSSSKPLETFQKISDVYIKNNLPSVGKALKVFNLLYSPSEINSMLTLGKGRLSRVLCETRSNHRHQQIILNDLIKVNLGSGETSLVNYLNLFQTASPLLEKVRSGDNLSQQETNFLISFFKKLDTLYDSSLLGRTIPFELSQTSNLSAKIAEIYQKYQVKDGQSISDRIAEMYLFGLGIKSIPNALTYINSAKESAHKRNLSQTDFSLHTGDLIKGVSSKNLDSILNFGCIAREYLGSTADSDRTPFDTDLIRLDSNYQPNELSSFSSSGYGDVLLIIKDRDQLQDTSNDLDPKYTPDKYELFYSGVVDSKHYGIRTGFPSSEIDFLVVTDTRPEVLGNIYFQISKHGVYIPVLNSKGKLLFTPDDYENYKVNSDLINQTLIDSNFTPSILISSLKKNPYLKNLYEMDSGVSEGYSIEKHTQMVMGQFEKYFSPKYQSNILSREEFRLLLSLHDIGKGESVTQTGSTQNQHEYTQKIVRNILSQANIPYNTIDIMASLIDQDILGDYFRGYIEIDTAVKNINQLSYQYDLKNTDLLETLKIYYTCDAGAYTSDAGGASSLDYLFSFNYQENTLSFSQILEDRYQSLAQKLGQP